MGTCVVKISALLFFFFHLFMTSPSIQTEKHSLHYIYTGFSKPVNWPGIYQFTAIGLLDGIQIDYYNSEIQKKIPKQNWMKEKMEKNYWRKGTESRKNEEQWINVNIDSLIKCLRQNESDLHVLQWRHGCEVEQQGDETKSIDEYCYDGENFLSFDDRESQWVTSVDTDLPTKWKWDNVPILSQHAGYLEKECVNWLNKFREYADDEFRKASPPDVHVFVRKSSEESKLKLTCMATGFYPRDVILTIRKYRTSLPENEIKSTGVRPNHEDTFQVRKSVEIQEDEKADYDCFVTHRTLKEPVIITWDGKCQDCQPNTVMIGGLLLLAFVALVVCIIKKKGIVEQATGSETSDSSHTTPVEPFIQKCESSSGDKPTDEYLQKKLGQKPKEESY